MRKLLLDRTFKILVGVLAGALFKRLWRLWRRPQGGQRMARG